MYTYFLSFQTFFSCLVFLKSIVRCVLTLSLSHSLTRTLSLSHSHFHLFKAYINGSEKIKILNKKKNCLLVMYYYY